jgi:hypothetical protein
MTVSGRRQALVINGEVCIQRLPCVSFALGLKYLYLRRENGTIGAILYFFLLHPNAG